MPGEEHATVRQLKAAQVAVVSRLLKLRDVGSTQARKRRSDHGGRIVNSMIQAIEGE